jgi:hypothetical protein
MTQRFKFGPKRLSYLVLGVPTPIGVLSDAKTLIRLSKRMKSFQKLKGGQQSDYPDNLELRIFALQTTANFRQAPYKKLQDKAKNQVTVQIQVIQMILT